MDSSGSDSDEFYECDDDYEDEKETTISNDSDVDNTKRGTAKAGIMKVEEKIIRETASESQINNNGENKENQKTAHNNNKIEDQPQARPEGNELKAQENEDITSYATLSTHNMQSESATEQEMTTMKDKEITSSSKKDDAINENNQTRRKEAQVEEGHLKINKNVTSKFEDTSTKCAQTTINNQTCLKTTKEVKQVTKIHGNEKLVHDNEENQLDNNENWEDEELLLDKCTISKGAEVKSISNKNVENVKEIHETRTITTIENVPDAEDCNIWDNNDDWRDINDPVAPSSNDIQVKSLQVEKPVDKQATDDQVEDLWNADDDWDNAQSLMPKKQEEVTMDVPDKIQLVMDKYYWDKDDLWGEDDNWGSEVDGGVTGQQSSNSKPEENIQSVIASVPTEKGDKTWGDWGTWGISSVLSTAANITTTVSQGLTNVLETGMGVPDPMELARRHRHEEQLLTEEDGQEQNSMEQQSQEGKSPFGLSNFVSSVTTITKLVETTGTKVISGGLGTLETIGKKTYQVLQENDPQLKKKRAFLKHLEGDKPVLSQILREAKERAETENHERERKHYAKKANYETMFDDCQGLVHLEALEMLSKLCDIKLQTILCQSNDAADLEETMEQIKDLCELNSEEEDDEMKDVDELKEKVNIAIGEVNVPISCGRLLDTFGEVTCWIATTQSQNCNEIHSHAIENLAQITAMAVEQYHKAGELLLIKEHRSTADEADSLVQLTTALTGLITILSTQYSEKLKNLSAETLKTDEIKGLISNIFLEAANSSRYIEDAFQLLIPVIQVGAV